MKWLYRFQGSCCRRKGIRCVLGFGFWFISSTRILSLSLRTWEVYLYSLENIDLYRYFEKLFLCTAHRLIKHLRRPAPLASFEIPPKTHRTSDGDSFWCPAAKCLLSVYSAFHHCCWPLFNLNHTLHTHTLTRRTKHYFPLFHLTNQLDQDPAPNYYGILNKTFN